jgi:hypothetical protein
MFGYRLISHASATAIGVATADAVRRLRRRNYFFIDLENGRKYGRDQ